MIREGELFVEQAESLPNWETVCHAWEEDAATRYTFVVLSISVLYSVGPFVETCFSCFFSSRSVQATSW